MTRDLTREDELYALTMKDTYGSLTPEEEARADALVAERAREIRRGKNSFYEGEEDAVV